MSRLPAPLTRGLFPLLSLGLLLGASDCRKVDDSPPTDTGESGEDSGSEDTGDSGVEEEDARTFAAVVWFETAEGERFPMRGAQIKTAAGETATTDIWGAFRVATTAEPEQICATEATMGHGEVCLTPEVGADNDFVIPANETSLWGQVHGAEGYPAVVRLPEFGGALDVQVSGEGFSVLTNASGQWVASAESAPGSLQYSSAKATFEGPFKGNGQSFTLENQRPFFVQAPTLNAVDGLLHAEPGETLKLIVQVKDPDGDTVSISWAYEGQVVATGESAELTLSESVGTHSVRVLAEDGRGGLRYASLQIQVGGAAVVRGVVSAEGSPLSGASVTVDSVAQTVDEEGAFSLDGDSGDRHVLLVQAPGYLPHSEVIYGSAYALDITLEPAQTVEFNGERGGDVLPADKSFNLVVPPGGVLNADGKPVGGQVALSYGFYSEDLPGEPWAENEKGLLGYGEASRALYLSLHDPKDPTQVYSLSPEAQIKVYLDKGEKPGSMTTLNPSTGAWDSVEDVAISDDDIVCPFPGGGTGGGDPDPDFAILKWPIKVEEEVGCLRLHVPGNYPTPAIAVVNTSPPRLVRIDSGVTIVRPLPPRTNLDVSLYVSGAFGLFNEVDSGSANTGSNLLQALLPTNMASTVDTCTDLVLREPVPGTFLTRYLAEDTSVTDAYYAAIDPNSDKDTFQKWLQSLDWDKVDGNGDFEPRSNAGDDAMAIYGNDADLGFGREMHLKIWEDWEPGTTGEAPIVAMYTTNYSDVHKAALGLPADVDATVAMEYSPYPGDTSNYYIKFLAFAPDGTRIKEAPLDDFGFKAMPDLCVNCHGGQPSSKSQITGNGGAYPNQGRMENWAGKGPVFIPYAVESFGYDPSMPQAPQELDFRSLNESLLLTNVSDDVRVMLHEWYDSTSYASDSYPVSASTVQDSHWYPGRDETGAGPFVGGDWRSDVDLYQKVVQPYCRSCHLSFDHVDFVNPQGGAGGFYGPGLVDSYVCTGSTVMPHAQVTQGLLFHDLDAIDELELYINGTCQP